MKVPNELKQLLIESRIENHNVTLLPREYLGLSQIGHRCARFLWYTFRWYYTETVSQRKLRIFERGNLEEPRVIRDLNKAGCSVSDEQHEIILSPYIKGHIDGIVTSLPDSSKPHLLEIKTMNEERFKSLKKVGLEKENFVYWAQAHLYMRHMGLSRTLFVATNKNTEERHYERIRRDTGLADLLTDRANDIVNSDIPPRKISESPSWHECKYCPAKEVCHYGATPERTCRSCVNFTLRDDGYYCNKHETYIASDMHKDACAHHAYSTSVSD